MSATPPGVEKILFTEEEIDRRIREVGAEITRVYAGRTVKLIGVLKGSIYFLTALTRYIEIPLKIDFLAISSFSNKTGAPGLVRISKDLDDSIEGEDVLFVPFSTAHRAASCRPRWSSVASKFPTAS
jgi:hypoxanthine phosphoribosyltransferase